MAAPASVANSRTPVLNRVSLPLSIPKRLLSHSLECPQPSARARRNTHGQGQPSPNRRHNDAATGGLSRQISGAYTRRLRIPKWRLEGTHCQPDASPLASGESRVSGSVGPRKGATPRMLLSMDRCADAPHILLRHTFTLPCRCCLGDEDRSAQKSLVNNGPKSASARLVFER